ncbi:DUF2062 domain-containing protein [Chromobacterium haemolyticum]|uniref:DUF2062 domain-containing protein n=2 Tax=Chromobacterium TaxID=535 RepID=A0A1W0D207_9NEIS|nr:DUF2062 domain-containing protein [Chromobacterium haemolyticum]OQS41047.1 hypothetical protein B0T45_09470 [Chromobacterium haemolyticum]
MTWFRRKVRKWVAYRHHWFQKPGLRRLAPYLDRPAYWSLNRRKVAMGVGVGLFAGLMPGPTQKVTAVALALLMRVNLPVAVLFTLYTNPLTVLPLYFLAYAYGKLLLGNQAAGTMTPPPNWDRMSLPDWWHACLNWLAELGWPLLVGLPALGLTFAVIGYALTRLLWRWAVISAWKSRHCRTL